MPHIVDHESHTPALGLTFFVGVTAIVVAVLFVAFLVGAAWGRSQTTAECHRNERFFHNDMRYYCVAWPEDPVTVTEEVAPSV